MSRENLEQFYQYVLHNQALQDRFRTITDSDYLAALIVELGKENGYDFNIEEVKIHSNHLSGLDSEELTDELLESVAGGGDNGICWKSSSSQ